MVRAAQRRVSGEYALVRFFGCTFLYRSSAASACMFRTVVLRSFIKLFCQNVNGFALTLPLRLGAAPSWPGVRDPRAVRKAHDPS